MIIVRNFCGKRDHDREEQTILTRKPIRTYFFLSSCLHYSLHSKCAFCERLNSQQKVTHTIIVCNIFTLVNSMEHQQKRAGFVAASSLSALLVYHVLTCHAQQNNGDVASIITRDIFD